MKKWFLILALSAASFVGAQDSGKMWIYFSDRGPVANRLERVADHYSDRAIERRKRQNISWTASDLPVFEDYILALRADGLQVVQYSRWLNAVSVRADDAFQRWNRRNLPDFVDRVEPVRQWSYKLGDEVVPPSKAFGSSDSDYGDALQQIEMINGLGLHAAGYRGEGMTIAVLDGGFFGAESMAVFDHVRESGRLVGAKDFVDGGDSVYVSSTHGTFVWSIMAAHQPGVMIGTAPDANYLLARTEDTGSETMVEEDNWVAGAEWADSAGADLINSSLGYTRFDGDVGYTYEDMDGNTTIVTRGADMAASKGILVVNSNGNYAQSSWRSMGAPADGDSVFSVGAVNRDEEYASFSSVGPTYDGRIKPNVTALGEQATISTLNGGTARGNGTSFSAPVITGMTAALWGRLPEHSNWKVMKAVEASAHLAQRPNNEMGYGIPDYGLAYELLLNATDSLAVVRDPWNAFPNPFINELNIVLRGPVTLDAVFRLSTIHGQRISDVAFGGDYYLRLSLPPDLPAGVYLLEWWANGERQEVKKVIRRHGGQ